MVYVVAATVFALIALVCVLIAAKQRDILAKTLDELDRLREERQVIIDFLHRSADDIGLWSQPRKNIQADRPRHGAVVRRDERMRL